METRTFGRTGRQVAAVGLGAWAIGQKEQQDGSMNGSYGPVPAAEARRVLERYVELGGNFIDTARAYGTSESLIGSCSFMNRNRESIFVATKTNKTGSAEALPEIASELETSLKTLRTEYVDLYLMHSPPDDPELIERVIEIFVRVRDSGKARAIGASVKGPDVTPATVALAKAYVDSGQIDALELIYSVFRRRHEETMAHAAERGVAIIARTVMESGFLSGKYEPEDSFVGHRNRWGRARRKELLEQAQSLAGAVEPPYQSLAQVAQKFALQRPEVSVIIPGARNVRQIEANWAVPSLPPLSARMREAIARLPEDIGDMANTGP